MRFSMICGLAALAALSGGSAYAANSLVNPGFEDPITYDGAPFVGSWEGFSGGGVASSANSTTTPRSGTQDLKLAITNSANSFAGAFQDVAGLTPGTSVTFSGWHMTPSAPFDVVVEYRFEWRNSVSNTEISRNQLNAVPTGTYAQFAITANVPAGADTARVVYDIESFGLPVGSTNNGIVYADDMSVVVAPEPTTLAALGLGGLLLRRRR
jgi:hypothetical protein